ncbi:MAG: hypothetical protein GF365_00825 [Candidatus Buchananbacteria bacterium]|nr:hypothetical protein [Candidatus Buchananbacteria bacterium]
MSTNKVLNELINDNIVRRSLAQKSHEWFFNIYFSHYVQFGTADFQKEMFRLSQETADDLLLIMAFRNSGKSTIMNTSYSIWSIIGEPQKKNIIIVSNTEKQARLHMSNIKKELEVNQVLKADLGPFESVDDDWGTYSLVLKEYGARITAVSVGQQIRGNRNLNYRPDLIICDDIEDYGSLRLKENRDKLWDTIMGDVIPAGDINTKLVFIGNKLHEDSVLMRLKDLITNKEISGHLLEVPLMNEDDQIAWPAKFKTIKDIEIVKSRAKGNAWQREYLLQIVPEDSQIITHESIKYYDEIPPLNKAEEYRLTMTGIDPACSKKETADFTGMVSGRLFRYDNDFKVYILANPINRRLSFNEIINTAGDLNKVLDQNAPVKFFIENVAFQKTLVDELQRSNLKAEPVNVNSGTKIERLNTVSHLIERGVILFPRKGAEKLIEQLINMEITKYDDLADAFVVMLLGLMQMDHKKRTIGVKCLSYYTNHEDMMGNMNRSEKLEFYRRLQKMNDEGLFLF